MRPESFSGSPLTSARAASAMASTGSIMAGSIQRSAPEARTASVITAATGASAFTAMPSVWSSAARPVVSRSSAALPLPVDVRRAVRVLRGRRRDVQDPATAPRAHVGQRELHEVERGAHARLERERDVPVAELLERPVGPEGGVVDEDVDRAEPRARVRHELRARARIEDVTPDRDGTAAVGLDRLDGLAERPGHAVRGAI